MSNWKKVKDTMYSRRTDIGQKKVEFSYQMKHFDATMGIMQIKG
jgi:hypothetical protein